MTVTISEFVAAQAGAEEFVDVNALGNRIRAERIPNDPPIPLSVTKAQMLDLLPEMESRFFAARDDTGALVGFARAGIALTGDVDHLAHFDIEIRPESRQQRIAAQLLARVVEFAEANDRRLMVAGSSESIPAGAAFLERIGGRPGMENTSGRLATANHHDGLESRALWALETTAVRAYLDG